MEENEPADVCSILPSIKMQVLLDVHIVFSGVIPLGQDPHTHELWIMAQQFGAKCYTEVNQNMTHLVAKKVITNNEGWNSKSPFSVRIRICMDREDGMAGRLSHKVEKDKGGAVLA
jgi:hypothetical protein